MWYLQCFVREIRWLACVLCKWYLITTWKIVTDVHIHKDDEQLLYRLTKCWINRVLVTFCEWIRMRRDCNSIRRSLTYRVNVRFRPIHKIICFWFLGALLGSSSPQIQFQVLCPLNIRIYWRHSAINRIRRSRKPDMTQDYTVWCTFQLKFCLKRLCMIPNSCWTDKTHKK